MSTVLQGLENSEPLYDSEQGSECPLEEYFGDSFKILQKYNEWKQMKCARLAVKAALPFTISIFNLTNREWTMNRPNIN